MNKFNLKGVNSGTIVRTLLLVLALTNQVLAAFGIAAIPISDELLSTLVNTAFTVITSLMAWWKNNSFTEAAQKGDEVKDAIKMGGTDLNEDLVGEEE